MPNISHLPHTTYRLSCGHQKHCARIASGICSNYCGVEYFFGQPIVQH